MWDLKTHCRTCGQIGSCTRSAPWSSSPPPCTSTAWSCCPPLGWRRLGGCPWCTWTHSQAPSRSRSPGCRSPPWWCRTARSQPSTPPGPTPARAITGAARGPTCQRRFARPFAVADRYRVRLFVLVGIGCLATRNDGRGCWVYVPLSQKSLFMSN